MTINIDPIQFLSDSLQRILKQVHLSDKFELGLFSPADFPASIKKAAKDVVPPDFFNGTKAKVITLKAKDEEAESDEYKIKIADFVKTTFFISKESDYSSNDVYMVIKEDKKKKDEEDKESSGKKVFFLSKIELV